jgi:sugar phosphate isomerase/epimerase
MKLSTSTLGCFKWDLPTTLARVREYGFDGVDFRGLRKELQLWRLPEFSTNLAETAARIRDAGLAVSCISSSVGLTENRPDKVGAVDEELARTAEICGALGCRQIRVFGGALACASGDTESARPRVIAQVVERARRLADHARAIAPVDLLIETHDDWTSSVHMAEVLERIGRDDVGCCWDVKHTYWMARETPETTWKRLSRWVRNSHWKDARRPVAADLADPAIAARVQGPGMLLPLGEGVCPLADCHALMRADGYDGWFTLEWEKQWHPHIAEPEVAFPGFVRYMRGLEARFAAT